MIKIDRTNFKKMKRMPMMSKFLILFAIILGFFVRSCWFENERQSIIFQNIVLDHQTHISVEVLFDVNNDTRRSGRTSVLVEIYGANNALIASRITTINLIPKGTTSHVIIMENFNRAVREGETIQARISLYHRPII